MNKNIRILEKMYLFLSILISIIIIFTPLIINSGVFIVPEEVLEVIIIAILFGIGFVLLRLYRNEVKKSQDRYDTLNFEKNNLEEHLMTAFKHIGSINVQIDEIRSAFSEIRKYPENKEDFKYILQFLGNRVLSMIQSDWVYFRIIDSRKSTTLGEYYEARNSSATVQHNFSNKKLLENIPIDDYIIFKSTQENFTIKTFCIIQSCAVERDQEILIKAIVNQLEMLFLIFSSNYYQHTGRNNIDSNRKYSQNASSF